MKIFPVLILLTLLFTTAAFAVGDDDCQKCGQRMITCWDLDILTTSPVTTEDSTTWKQLHYASDGYIGEIMTKEQGSCLTFLPACRIGSSATPWQNPCKYNGSSSTDTYNTDYEMFGDITGSEGAYVLKLFLVTVKRETVVSVTKNFEKAADAKWYGTLAALDLGGTSGGSKKLAEVIHDFEVKKRDAAQGIKFNITALNATVKINSENITVKKGGQLPVEIQLMDCDDEPLKAAKLELQVANGHFEKNEVETDDNGMAHAVYVAPDEEGTAEVKVEYNYRHPSEKLGFASEFTTIEIIDDRQVRYTAASYAAEALNEIPVDIKLIGCDKQDLATAVLELTAKKGKFKTTKVKPDSQGIAHAIYTAPGETGTDEVGVDYKYILSDGEEKYSKDSRTIKIVPPGLWLLTAEFSNSTISSMDTIDRIQAGNLAWVEEYHSSSEVETWGKLTALIENYAEDREHDFEFSTENSEPKLLTVSGTGREDDYSQSSRVIEGKLIHAEIWKHNINGFAEPGANIQFYYSNDLKTFSLSIGIKAVGVTHTRMYGYGPGLPEWDDKGESRHEQNLISGTGGDPGDPLSGCKITKTNSGYLIQISRVENYQSPSYLGTSYLTKTSKLTAHLIPYNQKTLSGKTTVK